MPPDLFFDSLKSDVHYQPPDASAGRASHLADATAYAAMMFPAFADALVRVEVDWDREERQEKFVDLVSEINISF